VPISLQFKSFEGEHFSPLEIKKENLPIAILSLLAISAGTYYMIKNKYI
jgi:hypothetical protein